jgi:hypothetical protein
MLSLSVREKMGAMISILYPVISILYESPAGFKAGRAEGL